MPANGVHPEVHSTSFAGIKRDDYYKHERKFALNLGGASASRPYEGGPPVIGDTGFTSAQLDDVLYIRQAHLVQQVSDKTLKFSLADYGSGVDHFEYIVEPYSVNSGEPNWVGSPVSKSESPDISVEGLRNGLYRISVRAVSEGGWRSEHSSAVVRFKNTSSRPVELTKPKLSARFSGRTLSVKASNCLRHTVQVLHPDISAPLGFPVRLRKNELLFDTSGYLHLPDKLQIEAMGRDGTVLSTIVSVPNELWDSVYETNTEVFAGRPTVFDDYEHSTEGASGRRGAYVASVPDPLESDLCLAVHAISTYDYYSAYLTRDSFRVGDSPLLQFDYYANGARMCLMVKIGGDFYDVQLGNASVRMAAERHQEGRYRIAGTLGYSSGLLGKTAHGCETTWARVSVDLRKVLAKKLENPDDATVECVALRAASRNRYGTRAYVDNFTLSSRSNELTFQWRHFAEAESYVAELTDDTGMVVRKYDLADSLQSPPPKGARPTLRATVPVQNVASGTYVLRIHALVNDVRVAESESTPVTARPMDN
ncbi:MAG: hypothetical protein U5N86_11820 [Planctomycetota bacterium]|nr:hypothetical protein [Planctomycetota bacterium]